MTLSESEVHRTLDLPQTLPAEFDSFYQRMLGIGSSVAARREFIDAVATHLHLITSSYLEQKEDVLEFQTVDRLSTEDHRRAYLLSLLTYALEGQHGVAEIGLAMLETSIDSHLRSGGQVRIRGLGSISAGRGFEELTDQTQSVDLSALLIDDAHLMSSVVERLLEIVEKRPPISYELILERIRPVASEHEIDFAARPFSEYPLHRKSVW